MTPISVATPAPAVTCFCHGRAEPKPLVFQAPRSESLHNGSTSKQRDVCNPALSIVAPGSASKGVSATLEEPLPHEAFPRARRRALPVAQRHRHADPRGIDALPGGTRRPSSSGYGNGHRRDPAAGARVDGAWPDARRARARAAPGCPTKAARPGGLCPLWLASPAPERALPAVLSIARGDA
jgi:hypothetical protein